jgi:hypothetical protein
VLDFPLLRRIARRQESVPTGELLAVGFLDLIHGGEIGAIHLLSLCRVIFLDPRTNWILLPQDGSVSLGGVLKVDVLWKQASTVLNAN